MPLFSFVAEIAINCVEIISPKAMLGHFDISFAFSEAKMVIMSKKSGKSEELNSGDMYYDNFSQRIFIRRIAEHPLKDAFYNLEDDTLHFLPKP